MKNSILSGIFTVALLIALLFSQGSRAQTTVLRQGSDRTLVLAQKGLRFGFFMPETAGYLRLGLMKGNQSIWLDEAEVLQSNTVNRGYELVVQHNLLGKGLLRIAVQPLSDSNGLILRCQGEKIDSDCCLLWAYGACSADTLPVSKTSFFRPEQCKDNVFSREINAFTVYYGTTERLKVMMGVFPQQTELRLADARKMLSPDQFWKSGKKTDAPALAASHALISGESFYTCIYRQNQAADYNAWLVPALFEKEAQLKNTLTNEKAKPHTDFGPDFHQH